jgi:broad specificity phosphatase PhoE
MLEASWMPDFDEAVAADEAERGTWDDDEADAWDDEQELPQVQIPAEESSADYLDRLQNTIESLDVEEPSVDDAGV